jgi:hypothetical protein
MDAASELEVAHVFRLYGQQYRADHPLPRQPLRVMRAIETCRTPALGGHVYQCEQCGELHIVYNSCRNRHCPKCQSLDKARWLEQRREELLPVPYFHNVFTLPDQLNPIALCNPKQVYDLLFRSASESLLELAADPRHCRVPRSSVAVFSRFSVADRSGKSAVPDSAGGGGIRDCF